jgi:hypothetical protein
MMKENRRKNMIIYLDMDGVIADFFSGLAKKHGKSHWKEIDDVEVKIDNLKGTDFFNTLDLYPTSTALVDFVKELAGDDWGICSSPLRGDFKNSAFWKAEWLEKFGFTPPKKENLKFSTNKPVYATNKAGVPNILIDDKPENVERWIAKGGIGIRYQANEDSLDDLKKMLSMNVEMSQMLATV